MRDGQSIDAFWEGVRMVSEGLHSFFDGRLRAWVMEGKGGRLW